MQVDLLLAKAQRGAALAKANDLHAQHPRVKFAGPVDVRDRQNQVIEPFDLHRWTSAAGERGEIATIGTMRPVPLSTVPATVAPPIIEPPIGRCPRRRHPGT